MALGALRLPNTSDPEPLKSNTALPCPQERKVWPSATGHTPEASAVPSPLPSHTNLTQVYLNMQTDRGAVIHVVLCRYLEGQAPGLPGSSESPKHVSNC